MWLDTQAKRLSPTKLIGLEVSNFNDFCLLHIILIMKLIKEDERIILYHLYHIEAYLKAFDSTYLGLVSSKLKPSFGQDKH